MSDTLDRLHRAFAQLDDALREVTAASEAVPDEEYSPRLPSLLACTYQPEARQGGFTLLGHVDHLAQALAQVLADPGHAPFQDALTRAMERRLFGLTPN